MKISLIELAGFRGIKGSVRTHIPSGFAVISGRNGSGKSTLCDAIEFVLTGTLDKYSSSKDDLESVEDYLWWRGPGRAEERYVRVGFIDENGEEIIRERRPGQREVTGEDKNFLRSMCGTLSDSEGFGGLSKTTILRDETIARLGLDMTGIQRFGFTKMALGVNDFTALEKKAGAAFSILEKIRVDAENQYRTARVKVNDLITTATEIRVEVSETGDIHAAEHLLRGLVGQPDSSITDLLTTGREQLRQLRRSVEVGPRILRDLKITEEREREVGTAEFIAKGEKAEVLVTELETSLNRITDEETGLQAELARFREEQPRLSDLAQLHEIGERLGLQAGHCPLCGSQLAAESLSQNISYSKAHVQQHATALNNLVKRLAELKRQKLVTNERLIEARTQARDVIEASNRIAKQRSELTEETLKQGYALQDSADAVSQLEANIEQKRERAAQLERVLGTLEATRLLDKLADLERQTAVARQESEAAEARVKKLDQAMSVTKGLKADIQRFSGEIVDEKLAELTPLLGELFVRLKPHLSWPELNYHLRGEVRHFLSLRVGKDLNPKFFFSSGQRRAAGLAFLLAVHLSRPWCSLNSLILDDAIQHIDDYRALHLVEVLSAIRQSGKQVICTVEDEELAQFLCRRLRCSELGEGASIEMEYSIEVGVRIAKETNLHPLPQEVLVSTMTG